MPAIRELVNRQPWDRKLRSHGFRIVSRPRKGPTLWVRNGKTVTEAEAMRQVMQEETVQ